MWCCHVLKAFRGPSGHELHNRYLNEFKIVLIILYAIADLPLQMGMRVLIGDIFSGCSIISCRISSMYTRPTHLR